MKINLKSGQFSVLTKEFPMNVFELQDTLDKLKIPYDKPIVQFEISEYNNMELPMILCDKKFSADIYKLNLVRDRTGHFAYLLCLKQQQRTREDNMSHRVTDCGDML